MGQTEQVPARWVRLTAADAAVAFELIDGEAEALCPPVGFWCGRGGVAEPSIGFGCAGCLAGLFRSGLGECFYRVHCR